MIQWFMTRTSAQLILKGQGGMAEPAHALVTPPIRGTNGVACGGRPAFNRFEDCAAPVGARHCQLCQSRLRDLDVPIPL